MSEMSQDGHVTQEVPEADTSQTSNMSANGSGSRPQEAVESRAKALAILDACNRADIDALNELAVTKGGFISDAIRRRACES
jgi:hypothetical protein